MGMSVKILTLSVCIMALMGCSRFQSETSRPEESSGGFNIPSVGPPGGGNGGPTAPNGSIDVLSNTRTASVVSANRALDNFVSCLGTISPSAASQAEYDASKGFLSIEGSAISVTSPMLKGLANVAGEVCNDLVQSETALTPANRRIFNQVDFSAGPTNMNASSMANVARRIARSCWGRNESSAELTDIQNNVSSAFSAVPNTPAETRNKAIYLCTAMTASFASYEM